MHYWSAVENLGDALAPVIFSWMLEQNGLVNRLPENRYVHLLTVGSVLGGNSFDATVWGSGIHTIFMANRIHELRRIRKLDIRAVRGPITRDVLLNSGYDCPEIYGDPGILMPRIYQPAHCDEKRYEVGMIRNFEKADYYRSIYDKGTLVHEINVMTTDYKTFIDEIVQCRRIISSSLHGIILAEAYGIPAVFLMEGMENVLLKFYDWYFSTGRYSAKAARTLDEALEMEPMDLPHLEQMADQLMARFPVDLWKK